MPENKKNSSLEKDIKALSPDNLKKCKHCAMPIPKEAHICPYCRKKQPRILPKIHPVKITKREKIIIPIAVTISLIVMVGILFFVNEPVKTPSYHFFSGDKAFLNESVLIASDEVSFEELFKIAVAHDEIGAKKLVLTGRAFIENGHVEVLVIETKSNTAKIRILEGRNYGKRGWIYTKFLSK